MNLGEGYKTVKGICFDSYNTRYFVITQERGVVFGTWEHESGHLDDSSRVSFTSSVETNEHVRAEHGRVLKYYRPAQFWKPKHGGAMDSCYVQDSRWVLTCTNQGYVYVFSDDILDQNPNYTNQKSCIKTIRLQSCGINTISSVDGVIATGNDLGHIRFYDKHLKILYWCQQFDLDAIVCLRFNLQPRPDTSDANHCCDDPTCCPDVPCTTIDNKVHEPPKDASTLHQPFIVRDFVVATRTGQIGLVDFLEHKLTLVLYGDNEPVTALELHPDGYFLLAANAVGRIYMYQYATRALQNLVEVPKVPPTPESTDLATYAVTYLKYSPSGLHLVCGLANGCVWFLHPILLTPLSPKPENQLRHEVTEIAFSSDEEILALTNLNFIVCVYKRDKTSANGYQCFGTFRSHYAPIVKILFGQPRYVYC